MHAIATLLIAALLAIAASAAGNQQPASYGRGYRVPIEIYDNLVFVPVRVNGSMPLSFVLDSGANSFLVDARRAAELGLKTRGRAATVGIGDGSTSASFADNVSLALPGLDLGRQTVAVLPFDRGDRDLGRRIDGVLGSDVFRRFVVEIAYAVPALTLYRARDFRYAGSGESVPLIVEGGSPYVRGSVEMARRSRIDGIFMLDTGGNHAFGLNRLFVEKHGLRDSSAGVPTTNAGLNGESPGRLGRVDALHVGRAVVSRPVTGFSEAAAGAWGLRDGLIGGEILRRFTVIFNYERRQVILEPNRYAGDPFEADMSGARLEAAGVDLRTIRVRDVLPDSPASEAGLRAADVIAAIDGIVTRQLDLNRVQTMMKVEGRSYLLEVVRGDATFRTTIRLRRLI